MQPIVSFDKLGRQIILLVEDLQPIITFDQYVTRWLGFLIPHLPFFNDFFSFLSGKAGSIFLWIIIAVLLSFYQKRQRLRFIFIFFANFGISFLLTNEVLKNIFLRPRPLLSTTLNQFQLFLTICPKDFSFPSSHAATSFAAATTLSYFDQKRKYVYYFIAILISYSRIYLGCHYLLDVVVGGLLGYLISYTTLKMSLSYRKKWNHVHKN